MTHLSCLVYTWFLKFIPIWETWSHQLHLTVFYLFKIKVKTVRESEYFSFLIDKYQFLAFMWFLKLDEKPDQITIHPLLNSFNNKSDCSEKVLNNRQFYSALINNFFHLAFILVAKSDVWIRKRIILLATFLFVNIPD